MADAFCTNLATARFGGGPSNQTCRMDQLLANLQASLAALRTARPNPTGWSGPAATAFTHRIDLLEIELVALSALVGTAALNPAFGGGAGAQGLGSSGALGGGLPGLALSGLNALPGGASSATAIQQIIGHIGIHF